MEITLQTLLNKVYTQAAYEELLNHPEWLEIYQFHPDLLLAFAYASLQNQAWKNALAYLELASKKRPHSADIIYFKGWAYEELGHTESALNAYLQVWQKSDVSPALIRDLGRAFLRLEAWDMAIAIWEKCIALPQPLKEDFLALGALYQQKEWYLSKARIYQIAQAKGFQTPSFFLRQAQALKTAGRFSEALMVYDKTLALLEKQQTTSLYYARIHSERILCSYFDPMMEQIQLSQQLQDWRVKHIQNIQPQRWKSRSSKQKLKVGYISADFRNTSLSRLLLLIWRHATSEKIETHTYYGGLEEDEVTQTFKALSPHWCPVGQLSLEEIRAQIQKDQIDILVDLSGHTSMSFLPLFAYKVAPIQISGFGFNGPSGLKTMDYRLTDAICTPPEWEGWEEKKLYLRSWIYWAPPYQAVKIEIKKVTPQIHLGCTNHLGKINAQVKSVWAEILKRSPESQLHLKYKGFSEAALVKKIQQDFVGLGIQAERIQCWPASAYLEYLEFYNTLDLLLDPFPCHGGITTCEALWMGVPVVTMDSWMRGGVSLLTQVGLTEWIAKTPEEYIEKVLHFARRPWTLEQRKALRHRFLKSPICDGSGLIKELEMAYFKAWHH